MSWGREGDRGLREGMLCVCHSPGPLAHTAMHVVLPVVQACRNLV
jgi:hypothetical protein